MSRACDIHACVQMAFQGSPAKKGSLHDVRMLLLHYGDLAAQCLLSAAVSAACFLQFEIRDDSATCELAMTSLKHPGGSIVTKKLSRDCHLALQDPPGSLLAGELENNTDDTASPNTPGSTACTVAVLMSADTAKLAMLSPGDVASVSSSSSPR